MLCWPSPSYGIVKGKGIKGCGYIGTAYLPTSFCLASLSASQNLQRYKLIRIQGRNKALLRNIKRLKLLLQDLSNIIILSCCKREGNFFGPQSRKVLPRDNKCKKFKGVNSSFVPSFRRQKLQFHAGISAAVGVV